jgi:acetyltransferase-like isoleucine patch superfamily enzyme
MKALLFYVRFFLKGGYINNYGKFKFSKTTWIGKSVSIFFEKPGRERQSIFLGEGVKIGHFSDLAVGADHVIMIKDFTTLNTHCKIAGDVTIERYCLLSSNILISSGAHYATKYPHLLIRQQDERILSSEDGLREHSKPVHIEEDVWIGFGVYIKQGVTIGRGVVIGANSVVLKDVPPYEIVAGSPARKIKSRFSFKPSNSIHAKVDEDLPYFYRGFDHFHISKTNPSNETGILCFEECIVAIAAVTSQIIVCKGFAVRGAPVAVTIRIDNFFAGEFLVSESVFELRVKMQDPAFLKRVINTYSFVTFAVPFDKRLCLGMNSITLMESV